MSDQPDNPFGDTKGTAPGRWSQPKGPIERPASNLPEGQLVDERLSECLQSQEWAALVVSIANLTEFREAYGFVASDDVLRAVSLMIHNTIKESGAAEDFLGHISPTDFVVVMPPDAMSAFQERIRSRLEQSLDYFYPIRDREQASKQPDRLSIRVVDVPSVFGRYSSVDQLKKGLLNRQL